MADRLDRECLQQVERERTAAEWWETILRTDDQDQEQSR